MNPVLSHLRAIEELYEGCDLLCKANNLIVEEAVDGLSASTHISTAWDTLNRSRLYIDSNWDEALVPAIGLVNDARCMIESLLSWNLGFTFYGKYSILSAIRDAFSAANALLETLEGELEELQKNGFEDDEFVHFVSF